MHDPLINWRLLKAEVSVPGEAVDVAIASAHAVSADDVLADQPASLLRRRSVLEDPRSFMPGHCFVPKQKNAWFFEAEQVGGS